MTKIGKWFIFFWFLPLIASAQVSVQAFVNSNEVSLGEKLVLTVSVSSNDSFEVSEPRIPSLEGFSLTNSYTSSSTSSKLLHSPGGMKIETVRRQDFNYELMPTKVGRIQIAAFEVTVDGKQHFTKPLVINVVKGSGQQNLSRGQRPIPNMPSLEEIDEADRMFEQLLQQRGMIQPRTPPANKLREHNGNEAFFIQAELDKVEVFEGEQITANWYIYTRGNILSLDRLKFPDLKGFWKEIIEEVPALQFQTDVVNGVPYKKALLASHALFPIKAGTAVVDEYKIKATVQTAGGAFGLFGMGKPLVLTRSSERINIKVLPLPLEGKPNDFTGAVGRYEMKAQVDGQSFPVNQPFSLKIRFDGVGNAKTIEIPQIAYPSGLEVYDTKTETKFFKNGRSYKEFEVLLIPRKEGEIQIPQLSASLFDPSNKKYYTRTTEPISIKISPAVQGETLAGSRLSLTKQSAELSGKQLPPPVSSWQRQDPFLQKALRHFDLWIWAFVLITLGFRSRTLISQENKHKQIRIRYHKRVSDIEKLIKKSDWRTAAIETNNLIYFVLGEISGLGGASRELDKILDVSPPSLRRDLGEELKKNVDLFQAIAFAPEEIVAQYKNPQKLKDEFVKVTKTLSAALDLTSK